jgi:hypothetical protein
MTCSPGTWRLQLQQILDLITVFKAFNNGSPTVIKGGVRKSINNRC